MNSRGFANIILVIAVVILIAIGSYFVLVKKPILTKPETRTQIPSPIIEKSNQVIISQVGNDFFEKYISLNKPSSKHYEADNYCIKNPSSCSKFLQKPHYLMVYTLKISEKPFVNGTIEFAVDDNGDLITERGTSGIPSCLKKPIECDFSIDEAKAITIAQGAGLEKGIKNWKTSFNWYAGDLKKYVWTVQNTLSEDKREGSSGGKAMVIDANTGKVIEITGWSAIP